MGRVTVLICSLLLSTPAFAGTAIVKWSSPTQRMDGTSLACDEIGGFKVHYGMDPTNLEGEIVVPGDCTASEKNVENLSLGTWFFAVSCYDTNGLESPLSEIKSKTFSDIMPVQSIGVD